MMVTLISLERRKRIENLLMGIVLFELAEKAREGRVSFQDDWEDAMKNHLPEVQEHTRAYLREAYEQAASPDKQDQAEPDYQSDTICSILRSFYEEEARGLMNPGIRLQELRAKDDKGRGRSMPHGLVNNTERFRGAKMMVYAYAGCRHEKYIEDVDMEEND